MAKKYKLNPARNQDQARWHGRVIKKDDILEGDEFRAGTVKQFDNIPALLIVVSEEEKTTVAPVPVPVPHRHPSIEEIAARSPGLISVPDDVPEDEDEAVKEDVPVVPVAAPEKPKLVVVDNTKDSSEVEAETEDDEDDEYEPWELTDIKGVGASRASTLSEAGYKDVEAVAAAKDNPDVLMNAVRGLGKPMNIATARTIIKSAVDLLED